MCVFVSENRNVFWTILKMAQFFACDFIISISIEQVNSSNKKRERKWEQIENDSEVKKKPKTKQIKGQKCAVGINRQMRTNTRRDDIIKVCGKCAGVPLPPAICRPCWASSGWLLPERPAQCLGYICWCYQLMNRTRAALEPCHWGAGRRGRGGEEQ